MRNEKSPYSARSDEELMIAYQQDDSLAFNELYDRMSGQIYGYLKRRIDDRVLIDDIFQGTLLKFHKTRSQYRAPLPVLPWLFTICRSVMIDSLRNKKRYLDRIEDVSVATLPNVGEEKNPEVSSGGLEGVPGLKKLSEEQKKALEFKFNEDLSYEEIAKRLGTSPSNVRQLVSRALRKLKPVASRNRGEK